MTRSVSGDGRLPPRRFPLVRSERLIAAARVVLAAIALLAIWLDPTQPARHVPVVYGALVGYLVYAQAVALVVWRLAVPPPALPLATLAIDLATSPILMYFTEGPASPFFLYFLFPLLCATLRWQWRGAARTAAVSLPVFIAMGAYSARVLREPDFELDRFLIRGAFLAVLAAILIALGAQEEQLRGEMLLLATGPRTAGVDLESLLRDVLRHAASVLGARRVVMAWEAEEEPWLQVVSWLGGEVALERKPPDAWFPLVPTRLADAPFLSPHVSPPSIVGPGLEAGQELDEPPVHAGFRERFPFATLLSVPLRGREASGRIFWLDKPRLTADDLLPAEIVAWQATSQLDQLYLLQRLRDGAAAEERVRLARDLHDGLLQSLAAAGLHVECARAVLDRDPASARERLAEAQRVLVAEQRDLRSFIHDLRPGPAREEEAEPPLRARLEEMAARVARQWGVAVSLGVQGIDDGLPPGAARQAFLMAHEAVVNAARHAGARAIRAEVEMAVDGLHIAVSDDGHGFPFQGRYDHAALAAAGLGPRSLRERAESLGGRLVVDSSEEGSRVELTLPLRAAAPPTESARTESPRTESPRAERP